ncbi:hypothetical protein TNCV_2994501 [Trichonephila clavipes]|nr:hypothetical protein TNCV_2994501 [Trichonephila clavipes]
MKSCTILLKRTVWKSSRESCALAHEKCNDHSLKCLWCEQVSKRCIQWHTIPLLMMYQYYDIEYTPEMCVLHDDVKCGRGHHYAVNRIWIRLKRRRHAITVSPFVVYHTIEGTPVCDVAEVMVPELTIYVATNVIELFMFTYLVNDPSSLISEFLTRLKDLFRSRK